MPDYPNALELAALKTLTSEWEHRAKLRAGDKTFASLLAKGWIAPFAGHNPNGDRYSITEAGRAARSLGPEPKMRRKSGLKSLPPRLKEVKSRLSE